MLIWLIILAVAVIFLVSSFVRAKHELHTTKAIVLIVILLIVAGSIFMWWQSNQANMTSPTGVINSVYSYVTWLGNLGIQLFDVAMSGVTTVGNAIKGNTNQTTATLSTLGKR